ncbi:hypothetical protein MtrunA17_Chr2g0308021 [Medicago truncatula]|uniref:Uncharacterized protein n=1 Tax=Medicago truncatula TaxID=3880 RepID=A0A396JD45_MEDTR|nr:hypothetical protein MtrunA17_Chr2g0308021 [Medicago truncatula]
MNYNQRIPIVHLYGAWRCVYHLYGLHDNVKELTLMVEPSLLE